MTILLAQDHAPERKESFYAKIKVSAFLPFEEGKEDDEEIGNLGISVYHCIAVDFTYFESLTVYIRAGFVSEKAFRTATFKSSEPLFLRLNGRVGTIPTYRVY